jgi:hypothetical protein
MIPLSGSSLVKVMNTETGKVVLKKGTIKHAKEVIRIREAYAHGWRPPDTNYRRPSKNEVII